MSKCMVCGDEFDPQYKAQRLCQSCLDKFTKRYWDWNECRKQGHTRRPTCIVCDKPMMSVFSVCPDCRPIWKKIYYQITRPRTLIQARNRMKRTRDKAAVAFEGQLRTGLDDDIAAARKAGLSYGATMMNAISRALAKRDRQRMEVRREAGAESGTDWATTLLFNCLHDKYGFGRNRFAAMNDMWEHLDEFQEGFIYDWRDELCEHGFDRFLNERIAERMQKMITGRTRDLKLMAKTRDMIAGVAIVIFWTLYTKYKWRDKRLKDLQNYYKDKVYVLTHNEVPIWEFMKCLNVECNIDYLALKAYEEQNGPVDIYHGNREERNK